ncbi:haloacid dehalogenase-like hydrolase [Streptomyces cinnamoneus]|uniref:Haloacid dehalogenase-like hydrolase n=1 Tax=Streptomyces cinnamoneus TaxID=53446 RepID=A0A2G1XHR9_STRCJ|nr:haloacid dehalogenase-like hydrolase [Streptomyces cinnamoneus]PHQ50766.1 haloacid dehalogenase-like hydrolase [Streptomyces cinnamoneus]PPT13976.1 haloacid dehalogenase-like hydrolase [Streptomyces cinnamoneus]
MAAPLSRIRLAAVNIDGVLLNDTFSPVIHDFVTSRGGRYTADVERAVFSQTQLVAAAALADAAGVDWTPERVLEVYFQERAAYLEKDPIRILDGAVDLLHRLRALGLRTVCYGGLTAEHFDRYLGEHADLFDGPGYVCTNDFRPGIAEITGDVFGLRPDEALFIDDVARVAETARSLGVAFIGHPSGFAHGFQGELMRAAGVRHVVETLSAIDEELLRTVDAEARAGTLW